MGDFDGLAAVVTGGASGIGLATARLLAARGARVACLDLQRRRAARAAARHRRATSPTTRPYGPASPRAAERLGGIDILVNNAGIGAAGTVEDNADDEWHRVLDVNVVGMVRVSRAALPHLRRVGARGDRQHLLDRRARRAAQPRALQREQGRGAVADRWRWPPTTCGEGIRVSCVNPGTVDTPWVRRLLDAADDPDAELAALQRPPAHRPAGQRRGGGGRDRLPGQPARRRHHRHGPRRRRRHARPAPAAADVTGRTGVRDAAPDPAGARLRPAGQPVPRDRRRAGAVAPSRPPGTPASASSTPRRTTGSGSPSAGSARRCAGGPRDGYAVSTKVGRLLEPVPTRPACATPRASTCRARTAGCGTSAATAYAGRWRRAWTGSAWTASTSSCCTTPRTTPTRRSPQAYPALLELRDEGVVGAIGAGSEGRRRSCTGSSPSADPTWCWSPGATRCWSSRRGRRCCRRASRRGVSVLNAGVFNSGLLAVDRPHADCRTSTARRRPRSWRGPGAIAEVVRRARHVAAGRGARVRRRAPGGGGGRRRRATRPSRCGATPPSPPRRRRTTLWPALRAELELL